MKLPRKYWLHYVMLFFQSYLLQNWWPKTPTDLTIIDTQREKSMNKILIIGTQPPCSRCKLLSNVVSAKVKDLKIEAEIKHLSYSDEEAKTFAKNIGLETGTAKDVAKKTGREIDFEGFSKLVRNDLLIENIEYKDYNNCNWSYELDEFLRPLENRANEAGILMTPVLIINNEVKYQGSLPRINKIDEWLLEFQKK